jgi:hypothetical protein
MSYAEYPLGVARNCLPSGPNAMIYSLRPRFSSLESTLVIKSGSVFSDMIALLLLLLHVG